MYTAQINNAFVSVVNKLVYSSGEEPDLWVSH